MTSSTGPATGSAVAASDSAWHALSPTEAASRLGVDPAAGLTSAEADARRAQYGTNTFAEVKKASPWQRFAAQYADPMQLVLLVAGIICLFLPGQFYTGVFLLLLTVFNAWMAMNQEGKAEASASALESMMVVKAKVRRNGDLAEIPMDQLVPGDIVNIEGRPSRLTPGPTAATRDRRVRADRRERPTPSRWTRSPPCRPATGSTWRSTARSPRPVPSS
jgi:Ca2+-transporting ATPase